MASIREAQESLGKDFDVGGIIKEDAIQLKGADKVIADAAIKFIKLAKQRINGRKKVDTGNLGDIVPTQVAHEKGKFSIIIGYDKSNPASKYYDFQNKGVKGIKSNQPNSQYKFRTLSVSKSMVEAIMQWYLRHKNYIKLEDQKTKLTGLQKKRLRVAKLIDPKKKLRQIAKSTAENIKERGIGRVGFFDDNIDKAFGQEFYAKLAQALGQDIALTITQTFKK
jgi:hypothetical protein